MQAPSEPACIANGLVLSIFPGIDLLGRAFEAEGYCIVRGPDKLWGGDIRSFHPPRGVVEGVIGGPPCQYWTRLIFVNKNVGKGQDWVVNEFARIVEEAQPRWFLMEEVLFAPMPLVLRYHAYDVVLRDYQVGGEQSRERRFTFGTPDYRMLNVVGWEQIGGNGAAKRRVSVLGHSIDRDRPYSLADACEAQGLPRDFTDGMPFTKQGKQFVIDNGVPMSMGRAIAQAVRRATR